MDKHRDMAINDFIETPGQVIVSLAPQSMITINGRVIFSSEDFLINVYEKKFHLSVQQLIPHGYSLFSYVGFGIGMHAEGNMLYFAANNDKGPFSMNTLFGQIDLSTCKLVKLNYLNKKSVKSSYPLNPAAIFWTKAGFTLNYLEPKSFLTGTGFDIHLQHFTY